MRAGWHETQRNHDKRNQADRLEEHGNPEDRQVS
jgi:hypothetical protein